MALSIEDRLKFWFVPGSIYYPHKIRSEIRSGEPELAMLDRLIAGAGGMAIDVGANRGIYSFALSKLCERVLAFEPNPELASFARRKLPANVELLGAALGATEDQSLLHIPRDNERGIDSHLTASLVARGGDQAYSVPVAVRTLDGFDTQAVRFIKIDVEGTEFDVLEGAVETIKRDRPVLLAELLAGYHKDPRAQIRTFCRANGYEACVMDRSHRLRPIDSLDEKPVSRNVVFATQEHLQAWSQTGIYQHTG